MNRDYDEIEEPKVRVPMLRSRTERVVYNKGQKVVTKAIKVVEKFPSRRQMHKYHHMYHADKKLYPIGDIFTDLQKDAEDEERRAQMEAYDDFDEWDRLTDQWFRDDLYESLVDMFRATESSARSSIYTDVVKTEEVQRARYLGDFTDNQHLHTVDDEIRMFNVSDESKGQIISIGSVIDRATSGGSIAKEHRLQLGNLIKMKLRGTGNIKRTYQDIHEFVDGKKVTKKIQVIVYYESEYNRIAEIVLEYIRNHNVEVIY